MGEMHLTVWIKGAAGAASLLAFGLFWLVAAGETPRIILQRYEEFAGMLKERQRGSSWYQRNRAHLLRKGASFHYGSWIDPVRYLALRVFVGMLGVLVLGSQNLLLGVLGGTFLYFLPDWLLLAMNKRENLKMLPEIKLIYHALEIQLKAGIYVTDALAECYGCVTRPRLRQALLDLAGQIVMKGDLYDALDCFQKKFDNRQIDSLCIILLQACESGQAVELLGDISEQLKDMEVAVMNSKKSGLDRSITFYQLGILAAVLLVVVYACVSYLFGEAVKL